MKCHYEVLGVPRDAEDDVIKKSYRKLALKLHPDKNPDNIEECTKQFHLVQQAYDVLLDPQERAWYDKHREAILKGGLGHGDDFKDDRLDVYQYFNTSCFSGFGDGDGGFYAVYREVFKQLATEDMEYLDDDDSDHEFPEFGDSQSSYEEVVGPFYAVWESFSTAKSYVWVEKYDTREAPNRQIRRLMEQDNKKLRDKAKKERNEEIRALAGFVKKRDKRVQAYKKLLEERAAEISKLAEERKRKDRERRQRTMEDYKETAWSAMSGLEKDLAQLEASYAEQYGEQSDESYNSDKSDLDHPEGLEIEEEYVDDLYCVACNKEFKSDKAFANHEKSKKHRENVAVIRAEMEEEGGVTAEAGGEDDFGDSGDGVEEEEDRPKTKLSKKQKKKRKQQQKLLDLGTEDGTNGLVEEVDNLDIASKTESNEVADQPEKATNDQSLKGGTAENSEEITTSSAGQTEEGEGVSTVNTTSTEDTSKKKQKPKENQASLPCNKCGRCFPSRNKLFQHVKETGHALRVEPGGVEGGEGAVGRAQGKGKAKKKGKR